MSLSCSLRKKAAAGSIPWPPLHGSNYSLHGIKHVHGMRFFPAAGKPACFGYWVVQEVIGYPPNLFLRLRGNKKKHGCFHWLERALQQSRPNLICQGCGVFYFGRPAKLSNASRSLEASLYPAGPLSDQSAIWQFGKNLVLISSGHPEIELN